MTLHTSPTQRQRLGIFWALTVLFLITMAIGVNSILYSQREAARAERRAEQRAMDEQRKICGIIKILDNAYRSVPPTTPTGRELATAMSQYRKDLGC